MGEDRLDDWAEYKQKVLFHLEVLTKSMEKQELRLDNMDKRLEAISIKLEQFIVVIKDHEGDIERTTIIIEELRKKQHVLIGIGVALIPISGIVGAIIAAYIH